MTTTHAQHRSSCCGGGQAPAATGSNCDYGPHRRVLFFDGMPLDADVLQDAHGYHVQRRRKLNRMLHGSGVVCGLAVSEGSAPWMVHVSEGFALDDCGRELELTRSLEVSLRDWCVGALGDPPDHDDQNGGRWYEAWLVLCYAEREDSPVSNGSCNDPCAPGGAERPSRVREGACIELRRDAPQCDPCPCPPPRPGEAPNDPENLCERRGEDPGPQKDRVWDPESFCCATPACPPPGDCVVLGKVWVECCSGEVLIDCDEPCRRYVLTPHLIRDFLCRGGWVGEMLLRSLSNPYSTLCPPNDRIAAMRAASNRDRRRYAQAIPMTDFLVPLFEGLTRLRDDPGAPQREEREPAAMRAFLAHALEQLMGGRREEEAGASWTEVEVEEEEKDS